MIPQEILHKIDEHHFRYVVQLFALLRIPSVSTYPQHAHDIRIAAEWGLDHLDLLGFEADLIETGGPPVVLAKRCPHPAKPTLLIYGHYDVQPAELSDGWDNDPFVPVERDGRIYPRGVSDDKGQTFIHVKAVESMLKTGGKHSGNSFWGVMG